MLEPRHAQLEAAARELPDRSAAFRQALSGPTVQVIAEIKRRSPSEGDLRPELEPRRTAAEYESAGASAISVLTNEVFFGGSLADLHAVSSACKLPVLRKDFLFSAAQLLEAKVAGASAVLLIVRILPKAELCELLAGASEAGLGVLVEVHTVEECDQAVAAGAEVIGVNCRDLDTLALDRDRADAILATLPAGVIAVAESGISSTADVHRVAAAGADAILVGTSLSRSVRTAQTLRALTGIPRRGR